MPRQRGDSRFASNYSGLHSFIPREAVKLCFPGAGEASLPNHFFWGAASRSPPRAIPTN
jgi:hypothetical protein